ncbi:MAG: cytochrome-c peroxidase, partial [Cyclobacteriaceae bacterium]
LSCATCHQQKHAFASPDHNEHQIDVGIMPHFNLAWDRLYLWNGKVQGDIEDIMLFEVEEFFKTDLQAFNQIEEYKVRFKQVYGIDEIKYENIAAALAQFERALISGDSKFDKFLRKEVQLSEQEFRGFNLFFSESGDCFHCHGTALFKDNLMHNNGLNDVFEDDDAGYFAISKDSVDLGKFKTPSLRNIAVTAPYMHDNRFATLKEVVDFYSDDVKFTKYTDPLMNHEGGINLTESEREDLIAFLYTLTDSTFITNEAYSNPFKE